MVTQSVRLPEELASRLEAVARATRRSKTSFIIEALGRYLDEREDLEVALDRLRDPATEWVDHEQVKLELGLD
jgi:RHH-type transcriptional regulator, rel operon repressor / antitoxin RelB